MSSSTPSSPLRYLWWVLLAFLVYEAGFWVDALSVDQEYDSSPSLTFREVRESPEDPKLTESWQDKKRRSVIDEDSVSATFLKMGQVGDKMPLNGRLAWNERDGMKLQKLVRGQRFYCGALTGDESLELEPLDVREQKVHGGYRYVLKMMDGLGKIYELPLSRDNHSVRLFKASQ